MIKIQAILLTISMLIILGCEINQTPPKRPPNVPNSALWGGGPDGGSWFLCSNKNEHKYFCEIYWDTDGEVRARGTYYIRRVEWVEDKQKADFVPVRFNPAITFDFFDGHLIHLIDNYVLVPHGTVDYPMSKDHGKKQQYDYGNLVGQETEY